VQNETPSVIAMSVSNEDYSPVAIHSGDAPPTPTGFAKIVSHDLPGLHTDGKAKFSTESFPKVSGL
jgi:hypothetical protein